MATFTLKITDNKTGKLGIHIESDPPFDLNSTPDCDLSDAQKVGRYLVECIEKVRK